MKTQGALRPELDQITATLQGGHSVWVVGNMDIPEPSAPRLADLPPPPLKDYGWSDVPYILVWTEQIAWFLKNHSVQFEIVDTGTNDNMNFAENLQLFVASGWKDSSSSNSPTNLGTNRP